MKKIRESVQGKQINIYPGILRDKTMNCKINLQQDWQ